MDYSSAEPNAIRAGDSASWTRELPEHSAADGWTLSYRLLFATAAAVSITSTGSGTSFSVSLTSAQTANWPAGQATLVVYAEKGTDRVTFESQPLSILPNLATASNFDNRSANAVALANLKAALASIVAGGNVGMISVQMGDRQMQFRTVKDLTDLIDYYEREVAKERAANAVLFGQSPGRVVTRM